MPKITFVPLLLCFFFPTLAISAQMRSPQTSFETYHQECLARTAQQKLPPEVAKELCDCTIKTFRQRYSLPQFRDLVRKSNSGDRVSRQTLAAVGEACFEQVLYEE